MSTHIEQAVPESSDTIIDALLVGPDLVTPVGNDVVTAITATLRNFETSTLIFSARNVYAGLDINGNFTMDLSAADLAAIGATELQNCLLTLKVTHSGGRKRNQEITFVLDNMQDV